MNDIIKAADDIYPLKGVPPKFITGRKMQREAFAVGYKVGASREREKAMKFAEWASDEGYDYIRSDKQWLRWGTMDEEEAVVSKSTSELWAMAEAGGVFTQNKEG